MIARKGIYAIVTTLTYLVLIILYFELPSDTFALKDEDKKCNKNSPCVRFCLTHLKNRTNSWLFAQFNESFLSDAPYDGFNNTIDLENSDDETKVEETTTQKPKKGEEKKDPQDVIYGDRDYYYDDFGRKQKMKGKTKTKREIEDFDDFDNYDDDLSVRERRETKEIETTTLEFNDSTTLESNSSEEMKQENIVMKIRKIKIYRLPPSCIDSDSNQFHPLTDMKYDLTTGGEFYNVSSPRISYNADEYCLQEIVPYTHRSRTSLKWNWRLKLCHKSEVDPKLYRYLAYLLSSLTIGIVLCLYGGYKDLQCTRGKCLIYFLWSHLSIFALLVIIRVLDFDDMVWYDIYQIIRDDCIIFAFFCLILFFSFIGVHNMLRLWTFSRLREDSDIFVVYAFIIGFIASCSACSVLSAQYFMKKFDFEKFNKDAAYILYTSLASIGSFFTFFSAVMIFRISEVIKKYHQKKYLTEVEWFWMFGALYAVMMIEVPFLKISLEEEDSPDFIPSIFVNMIILLSGLNIFAIFAVREKTRKATASSEF